MKKIKLKKLYSGLICFAAAFAMILSSGAVNSMNAYAETVTTTLAEMKQEGELIAVFTFDKEKPSITLVSPHLLWLFPSLELKYMVHLN